jgi:hypothetical protein
VSRANADHIDSGGVEAHRLLEATTRLKEVRKRYASDSGDGERFAPTRDHLDSIISDLEGWLKPGGRSIEIGALDLRLTALQEMIESVGFPGYAHVIANIRENLLQPVEEAEVDEEPPPPQRYEPPPANVADEPTIDADLDEWDIRAEVERLQRRWGWRKWSTLIGAILAVAAALFFLQGETEYDSPDRIAQVPPEVSAGLEPTAVPAPTFLPDAMVLEAEEQFSAESLAQIAREISLAHHALSRRDTDTALQHLLTAAAIDRHDRRLSVLAGSLIDALLTEADEAFDNGEWGLAADRVEVARRIARGLYLDPSAIEQMAQKHADMTRFEDITPDDLPALKRAVGHALRVTQIDGEVIFGRLEAVEDNTLLVEVQSGVEGGGAEFSKSITLELVRELRVFEAEQISEIVLGQE